VALVEAEPLELMDAFVERVEEAMPGVLLQEIKGGSGSAICRWQQMTHPGLYIVVVRGMILVGFS
jgi:hypothetical protein